MNVILEHLDKISPDAMTIVNYDINQRHGETVWDGVVKHAADVIKGYTDPAYASERYQAETKILEEEILEVRFGAGEEGLKKKNGEWNYSKVSQNSSYRSNKSVIIKAIEAGVQLTDGIDPVPKSKLEKETKTAVSATSDPEKSDYEKACTVVETLYKLYKKIEDDD
mgnify:FL=1